VQAYFRLFTGARYVSTVPLKLRARERYAVLTLAALILAGGFFPQPGVASRHRAAEELLQKRLALGPAANSYAERPSSENADVAPQTR